MEASWKFESSAEDTTGTRTALIDLMLVFVQSLGGKESLTLGLLIKKVIFQSPVK